MTDNSQKEEEYKAEKSGCKILKTCLGSIRNWLGILLNWLGSVIHKIIPWEAAAWKASWYPIEELLNTEIDAEALKLKRANSSNASTNTELREKKVDARLDGLPSTAALSNTPQNTRDRTAPISTTEHLGSPNAKEGEVSQSCGDNFNVEEKGAQLTIDERTIRWRDRTLEQLNFIGLSSALVGGVIASAISWKILDDLDDSQRAIILALWYSALVLSIGSIGSATQQAVALNRLSTYKDGLIFIRNMMKESKKIKGRWRVQKWQLFVLRSPILMLNFSIYIFGGTLAATIGISTKNKHSNQLTEVLSIFFPTFVITTVMYLFGAYYMYRSLPDANELKDKKDQGNQTARETGMQQPEGEVSAPATVPTDNHITVVGRWSRGLESV